MRYVCARVTRMLKQVVLYTSPGDHKEVPRLLFRKLRGLSCLGAKRGEMNLAHACIG